jgi:hypothetical protein
VTGVLAFHGALEVLVQDSSSDDATEQSLREISDSRLRYFRVSPTLTMTENFETSIGRANGEFIVMIGDDDGLSPWIWDCIVLARAAGADSLVSMKTSLNYYWPDFTSKYQGNTVASRLLVEGFPYSGAAREVNLERAREEFLHAAGQGCLVLPRVYHGLVHRSLLDAVRSRFGRLFFGVSPDVSFAYAAACVSRKHLCVDYPVSISGNGADSNAGRSARREHKGELESDPHLRHYNPLVWPADVPRFFAVETVWAQATITILEVVGTKERGLYSFARLYALCFLRHWDRRRDTLKALKAHLAQTGRSRALFWGRVFASAAAVMFADVGRAVSIIKRRLTRTVAVTGYMAHDVAEAMDYLRQLKMTSR